MAFTFDLPTKIVIGEGCSGQLGEHVAKTGAKRVMCVYDKGIDKAGLVGPVITNLEAAGLEVIPYDGVLPDPPMEMIETCTGIACGIQPDAFVAIGGGSSIDTTKAVNANMTNPGTLKAHTINLNGLKVLPFDNPLKPFFALPTTAGTGSEVSPGAVITDRELKLKLSIISPDLMPTMAIIDPALMVGLPPHITASTGLDAMAHAMEGMMSGMAIWVPSPMRDGFALTAVELVLNNLLTAIQDGKNIKARTDMSYAAFLAMLGSTSGYSMGHVMGHAIAEVSNVHNHGFLCASIMPYNVEFLAECIPQQLRKIAAFLKVDTAGKTDAEIGTAVRDALKNYLRSCGAPTLKELGMKPSDMEEIVRHTMAGTWYMLAPKKPSQEEMTGWLRAAYEG